MEFDAAIRPCPDYSPETVRKALRAVLEPLGGLDWVTPGMRVAVKANLVTFMKPESAATTHPELLLALCELLAEKGASVTVGDSPGGPWSAAAVNVVYNATGVRAVERAGAALNKDFGQREVSFPEGKVCRSFPFTAWLDEADAVVDFCKLKTHGLTAMSCAVKNLFGVIPGTRKPEFHYLYPQIEQFADMLVDLNEYVKPRLTVVDAVECMEGNGPTQGTPKHVGCLIASKTPHCLDVLAAAVIGLEPKEVPTIAAAVRRGLCPDAVEGLPIAGDWNAFVQTDFELITNRNSLLFVGGSNVFSRLVRKGMNLCLVSRPKVKKRACVGCGRCRDVCPAHTIAIENKKAVIDRKQCIKCFCCQEFCPVGAMRVHRSPVAKLLTHGRRQSK